jgi:hypothetical protein
MDALARLVVRDDRDRTPADQNVLHLFSQRQDGQTKAAGVHFEQQAMPGDW